MSAVVLKAWLAALTAVAGWALELDPFDQPNVQEAPSESYSFTRLIDAQADGDLDTLRAHGLPVARAGFPSGDPVAAIDDLVARMR